MQRPIPTVHESSRGCPMAETRRISRSAGLIFSMGICLLGGCFAGSGTPLALDTELMILNVSRNWYMLVELEPAGQSAKRVPMLPPGAVMNTSFRELFGTACPFDMIVRTYLFKRTTAGDPNGPFQFPQSASAEVTVQPYESIGSDSTIFPIVLRQSEGEGEGGTMLFAQLREHQLRLDFWGREPNIPIAGDIPRVIESKPTSGCVLTADGRGVSGVGVMLRPTYRRVCPPPEVRRPVGQVTTTDPNYFDVPDAEADLPIDVAITDGDGKFTLSGPPGSYAIDVFSDKYIFAPSEIFIEAPMDNVVFLAKPNSAGGAARDKETR